MKKNISLLIVLVMGIALLAGCGNTQKESDSNSSKSAAEETANSNSAAPAADMNTNISDNKYVIYVLDAESGEPIRDAKVQFCNDTSCMMAKTDENGCAVFESDPGNYTAHILKAPEGYEGSEEELVLTADEHTATFKLAKQ